MHINRDILPFFPGWLIVAGVLLYLPFNRHAQPLAGEDPETFSEAVWLSPDLDDGDRSLPGWSFTPAALAPASPGRYFCQLNPANPGAHPPASVLARKKLFLLYRSLLFYEGR